MAEDPAGSDSTHSAGTVTADARSANARTTDVGSTDARSADARTTDVGGTDARVRDARSVDSDAAGGPDTTSTLAPLEDASPQDWLGSNQDPDVLLSVPNLGVDRIKLTVENLHARVDLHARVLDIVELSVGADVRIDSVDLEIDNVRAQAMLKVKLDKVREIVGDVVTVLREHPEILTSLTAGAGDALREIGTSRGGVDRRAGEPVVSGRYRDDHGRESSFGLPAHRAEEHEEVGSAGTEGDGQGASARTT